jgi:hypothetical protein
MFISSNRDDQLNLRDIYMNLVIGQDESIVAFSAKFTRAHENLANVGIYYSQVDVVDQYLHCLRFAPDIFHLLMDQFRQHRDEECAINTSVTSLTLLDIQFRLQQEEARRQSQSTIHLQLQQLLFVPTQVVPTVVKNWSFSSRPGPSQVLLWL